MFYINCILLVLLCLGNVFIYFKTKQLTRQSNELKQKREQLSKILSDSINASKILLQKADNMQILIQETLLKKKEIEINIESQKQKIEKEIEKQKQAILESADIQVGIVEDRYKEKTQKLKSITTEINDAENQLQKLKASLNAGVQEQIRKREQANKMNFYKLSVSNKDLEDIKVLNQMKSQLKQPVLLSKLIWSTYFQKQTNELCNRVLSSTQKTGIYKITNTITEEAYIGQSVNIAERFKQHIKCGLGIDAPSTNKLYNNMQQYGVWNFTFEILEECSRADLNEKEKFWIEMFQTDKFGLNSTKGNK